MGDVPCNQNNAQDVTAISSLCSTTTFHRGIVNSVLTTRRATRRCLSYLIFGFCLFVCLFVCFFNVVIFLNTRFNRVS